MLGWNLSDSGREPVDVLAVRGRHVRRCRWVGLVSIVPGRIRMLESGRRAGRVFGRNVRSYGCDSVGVLTVRGWHFRHRRVGVVPTVSGRLHLRESGRRTGGVRGWYVRPSGRERVFDVSGRHFLVRRVELVPTVSEWALHHDEDVVYDLPRRFSLHLDDRDGMRRR